MSTAMGTASDVPVTTVMVALLFGTNALLFILFQAAKSPVKTTDDKKDKEKQLSKPFIGTIDCFADITTELFRCGLVLALTYICEKHWFFQHSGKEYSRDLFLFVLILFFGYAFYTIKPIHDLSLLGREQTEEWKGWMQFIFLLYHYFHAEEVYNSVRVMITCYVWMTGFGNFSFFYMKQDYGWLRVAQMMWRLNFAVLLLMWTHGNTYILYYICPMHTFYFLMVYTTMYLFSSINHSKWGIRFKLLITGVLIYVVWDVNSEIFDTIFSFLGTDSIIGAKTGSVYEYYFRTSLDHWSSFLGMIFALNFPMAEQYFHKARGWPLAVAGVIMGAATIWWIVTCYTLDKMSYNLTHSYFAIIPLTSYIFFRNITPGVRSGVSMSLHDLGKTTLETYLLQHHIWLTSNAKTLLTIVPGHPWINFALATMLFFTVAKELYRITMSLRGMIMPDDQTVTLKNIIGMGVVLAINFGVAAVLAFFQASVAEVCMACVVLLLLSILAISRLSKATAENYNYQVWSTRMMILSALVIVLGVALQLSTPGGRPVRSPVLQTLVSAPSTECLSSVSTGQWYNAKCPPETIDPNKVAYCQTSRWRWKAIPGCPLGMVGVARARSIFKNKKVSFMGDSVMRNVYYQFVTLVDPEFALNETTVTRHSDIVIRPSFLKNATFEFHWTPLVDDITRTLIQKQLAKDSDMIVLGAAAWHALNEKNISLYSEALESLKGAIAKSREPHIEIVNGTRISEVHSGVHKVPPPFIWLQPTTVIDGKLTTSEKLSFMPEATIEQYRVVYSNSSLARTVSFTVDPRAACTGREATDGIHYSQEVYKVIAQMTLNSYILRVPALYSQSEDKKKYEPKKTGGMSFPTYGAVVLALSAIMLFSMDSFLGIGFLSLLLSGRSSDWESAYGPLHKKILKSSVVPTSQPSGPRSHNNSPIELESLLGTASEGDQSRELLNGK